MSAQPYTDGTDMGGIGQDQAQELNPEVDEIYNASPPTHHHAESNSEVREASADPAANKARNRKKVGNDCFAISSFKVDRRTRNVTTSSAPT